MSPARSRAVWAVPLVVVTAALLLVALASHVVPPHYGRDRPPGTAPLPTATMTRTAPTRPVPTGHGTSHPLAVDIPAYVLLAVIGIGVLWGLWHAGWGVGRRRRRTPSDARRAMAPPDLARRVGTAVDEGLDELSRARDGSVSDAIVACWVRLEDAAAGAGVLLHDSDTPAETVVRVLRHAHVDDPALQTLADLYREARFSSHPMDDVARQAAIDALGRIRHDLTARTQ